MFLRTPVRALGKIFDHIAAQEQHAANRDSTTQAQMAHLLLMLGHAYSGSKKAAPRTKPREFLPYPDFKGKDQEGKGPDKATTFVLSEVARQRRIPPYVLVALITSAE